MSSIMSMLRPPPGPGGPLPPPHGLVPGPLGGMPNLGPPGPLGPGGPGPRSEEHTSELQAPSDLVCRLLLEKKNRQIYLNTHTFIRSRNDPYLTFPSQP